MNIDLMSSYLILSAALFVLGMFGVLVRRNVIVVLMSVELMLNAANMNLIAFANYYKSLDGEVFVLFVMAIAAAEAAVGLAIVVGLFRNFFSVKTTDASLLKG